MSRQALTPSSALPLVYFSFAHLALALAFGVLVFDPGLPGGYFLHPRFVALVHLVTVGWISGSILGAFYIVAPLALGMALPVRWGDWLACTAFISGTSGMVASFWTGHYGVMAWAALLVTWAVVWLAARAVRGARTASAPWPVLLHVLLAFANMIAAALFGTLIGLSRAYGVFDLPQLAAVFAHMHLAAIGWPMMMVVGLAYRLVPMFLPARMPAGRGPAGSAVLIELGLLILVTSLLMASAWVAAGAAVIAAGLVVFVRNMRAAVQHRLPRPPALPRRDWSTWQTHVAIVWLIVSAVLGLTLTMRSAGGGQVTVAWVYGVAGLIGFLSQIVVGIQGRLVPLYAYYRAMAAQGGAPPHRAANQLPSAAFARPIFLLWTIGVPWLAWGLATTNRLSIRLSSAVLLAAVIAGAAYLVHLMRAARGTSRSAAQLIQEAQHRGPA